MPTTASSRAPTRCGAASSASATRQLVDALYGSAQERGHIKVEVTFEDGRKGAIEGNVEIRDVAPHPGAARTAHSCRSLPSERASPGNPPWRHPRLARPGEALSRSSRSPGGREHQPAFGGVKALTDISFDIRQGRDPRHHRPQRRRQVVDAERASTASITRRRAPSPTRADAATRCARTRRPSRASPAPSRTSRCSRACRPSTTL